MNLEIIERHPFEQYGLKSKTEQDAEASQSYEEIKSGGSTTHDVWACDSMWSHGVHYKHPPAVGMCNSGDPFYCQYFNSRAEVDNFIEKLKAAANEAWGSNENI